MRTRTRSPTPCASPSRHSANGSVNRGSSPPCPAPVTASAPSQTPTPTAKNETVDRAPGLSVRLKLTLSSAAFRMLAGVLLLAAVWLFLLRYVPDRALIVPGSTGGAPIRSVFHVRANLLHAFSPRAAAVLMILLVLSLLGGWLLAGRMLGP